MGDMSVIAAQRLGVKVARATATLPQSAAAAIFNVTGGRVMLLGIVGTVTTVIQTQADATKLTANPTAAGVASVDLCATADITALAVGSFLGITGTFATALQKGGAVPLPALPIVVTTGTIDLDCAASNTGSVKWDLWYLPIDSGARVASA